MSDNHASKMECFTINNEDLRQIEYYNILINEDDDDLKDKKVFIVIDPLSPATTASVKTFHSLKEYRSGIKKIKKDYYSRVIFPKFQSVFNRLTEKGIVEAKLKTVEAVEERVKGENNITECYIPCFKWENKTIV